MDWNRIEGNWKQAQGRIKEKWGKLTEDDLTTISGRREQLDRSRVDVTATPLAVEYGEALVDALE